MSRRITRVFPQCTIVAGFMAVVVFESTSRGALISYGNFGPIPPGMSFLNVKESSTTDPVPLYGTPTPFVSDVNFPASAGLEFSPQDFGAESAGGGIDITDGQISFTMTNPLGFAFIQVRESGTFTLSGAGTSATSVAAGSLIVATVTEINGAQVQPFVWGGPANNSSVTFNLAEDAGADQPWSLDVFMNVAIVPGVRPTRIDVVINNQMLAFSETASTASIVKTGFSVEATEGVPEPLTSELAAAVLVGLTGARRRRS